MLNGDFKTPYNSKSDLSIKPSLNDGRCKCQVVPASGTAVAFDGLGDVPFIQRNTTGSLMSPPCTVPALPCTGAGFQEPVASYEGSASNHDFYCATMPHFYLSRFPSKPRLTARCHSKNFTQSQPAFPCFPSLGASMLQQNLADSAPF